MTTTPIRSKTKKIELLSPAKDLATAIAAIDHGADAVYIGADDFSARSAAANDIADISSLAEYAHRYRARVYITLNTIIYDSELERVREMVYRLHEAGTDALIVQDMALLEMELPPIELHASTQCDIRDAAKAIFLHEAGFTRVVAARETPLSSLREMASAGVEVEAFVHGALCVCYSGQCYMSQAFASRSANRGRCAQICRLPYELTDIQGRKITQSSALHALSLKDMNRSDYLGDMIDAGVTSFKIEGRLKDASYVKNITAWYRKKLDEAINSREGFSRSSDGISDISFIPDPNRSFNRGFTGYFLDGQTASDVWNPVTPKSTGEPAGKITRITSACMETDSPQQLNNGDGFLFVTPSGQTGGFRIDRAEGRTIYPTAMPDGIKTGSLLYRNYDNAFERALAGKTASRHIPVDILLEDSPGGYTLTLSDGYGFSASAYRACEKEDARTPQREKIISDISKLGGTEFSVSSADAAFPGERFIPGSLLSSMRRECCLKLREVRVRDIAESRAVKPHSYPYAPVGTQADYTYNISNEMARGFYEKCGITVTGRAFESENPGEVKIAECRHCIKYSLGYCPKHGGRGTLNGPVFLRSGKIRMKAVFDCRRCVMEIFPVKRP